MAERPPPGHAAATRAAASSTATTRAGATDARRDKFDRMLEFADALPRDPASGATRDLAEPRAAAREGAGRGRPAAGADAHPGRQRRVRAAQPLLRADDPARPARRVEGAAVRFRFRGKSGKQHEVGLRDRRLAGGRPALPGPARPGAVPVRGRGRRGARRRVGRRQRIHPRGLRRRLHGQGLPDVGRDGARVPGASRAPAGRSASGRAKGNVVEAIRQTADRLGNTPAVARGELRPPGGPRGVPRGVDPREPSSRRPKSRRRRRPARRRRRSSRSVRCCGSDSRTTRPDRRADEPADAHAARRRRGQRAGAETSVRRRTRSRGARSRSRPSRAPVQSPRSCRASRR